MAEKKKLNLKLPITIFELVVYILAGLMGIWGLVYISLAVAVNFVRYDNALIETDNHLKETTNNMGFLEQGILVLSIAVIVAVIVLLVNAKTSDRVFEKEQRRKQARFNRKNVATQQEEIIVEAETTPVEEPAPEVKEEKPVEEQPQESPATEEKVEEETEAPEEENKEESSEEEKPAE